MSSFNLSSKCIKTAFLIFSLLFIAGCGAKKTAQISGKTMGTTYHVTVVAGYFDDLTALESVIEKRLEDINRSMSTFLRDSEISRFNAETVVGKKIFVSDDFIRVLKVAEEVHALSGGAWDGTVKPLVDLWGFGGRDTGWRVPESGDIDRLLQGVGFRHIEISDNGYLIKHRAPISLDLASIAKGYAVDQVSQALREKGIENFLVEIGGEVFASGRREDGGRWRVGINVPLKAADPAEVYKAVGLEGKALATSGDYRNFFELDGKRFSHILDPRTGYPVANNVVSVSIIADTCTFADGLATAVMVLGHEQGIDLLNRLDRTEGLIVVQEKEGTLTDYPSKGFNAYGS